MLSFNKRWDQLRQLKRRYDSKAGNLARPTQFAAVGFTGMIVDLCAFSALLHLGLLLPVARALAIAFAMTWNFYLNRRLTFSYARSESALRQYLLFCASCSLGAIISWSVSVSLCSWNSYFGTHQRQAALVGIAAGLASNFLLSSKVVFRRRSRQVAAPAEPVLVTEPPA
jgi:dolichol-phosphate mannosyltransferase